MCLFQIILRSTYFEFMTPLLCPLQVCGLNCNWSTLALCRWLCRLSSTCPSWVKMALRIHTVWQKVPVQGLYPKCHVLNTIYTWMFGTKIVRTDVCNGHKLIAHIHIRIPFNYFSNKKTNQKKGSLPQYSLLFLFSKHTLLNSYKMRWCLE